MTEPALGHPADDADGLGYRDDLPPDRIINRGHPAGDFLEAYDWLVVAEATDRLVVDAHLPERLLNPRGQLFGGFTAAYVDLVSLHAHRAGPDRRSSTSPRPWLITINMRIDYFEPIVGPRFVIDAAVEHRRGPTSLVATKMFQGDALATYALTTMRAVDPRD